ncbi:MAG: hypothetical protein IKA20_00160 [Clostridia bacterium]|nr:hypothetical protein [Clostridia bacterium]
MKKTNKKLITLILAGALCTSAAVSGAFLLNNKVNTSAAEAVSYKLTDVFVSNGAISAEKVGDDADQTAMFTLGNEQYARIKRDLAFKWYEAKGQEGARYLSMSFALKDTNFKTLSFAVESTSSVAAEDEKAVNVIKLKNENGVISAAVISDGMEEDAAAYTATSIATGETFTISLGETFDTNGDKEQAYDEYAVQIKVGTETKEIGSFTHIATNFAEYVNETNNKMYPLAITAETEEGAKTTVYLEEINKQRFDNVTGDTTKQVKDTAAPVLVVNEDINGFQLGAAFSLNYEKIDVLQSSSLTESKKYYQYNPTHDKVNYDKTLTTSTYFMDTTYVVPGTEDKYTSVYKEEGAEYVSIKITLGDNTFNDSLTAEGDEKVEYDLAWYAQASALKTITLGEGESAVTTDYIIVSKNESSPYYKYLNAVADASGEKGSNVVVTDYESKTPDTAEETELEKQVKQYNDELKKAAEGVYAGSNAYIYFPSLDWLIGDDNGYRNLRFSISYKTASSSTQTSTNLSYNNLKLSASKMGIYEFKIIASDEAGNAMKYYNKDGELVDVTTSNVWDIEEIPYFTYTIANQGLKVKDGQGDTQSEVKETKTIGKSFSFSGVTIVGATSQQSEYQLYRVNLPAGVTQDHLANVTYQELGDAVKARLAEGQNDTYKGDYFALYLDVYKELVAKEAKVEKSALNKAFEEVAEYNEKIQKGDKDANGKDLYRDNKLEWKKSGSASFTAAEEGTYLVLADYWEKELPTVARTSAFKVVIVDSKADVIKGETEWLKNNLVSVILFSVAAVMLILIIILLLIKPSDETLEDVEKKADAKKATKTKKVKKSK